MENINQIKHLIGSGSLIVAGFLLFATATAIAQSGASESQAAAKSDFSIDGLGKANDASKNNEIDILKAEVAAQRAELNALKKAFEEQRRFIASVLPSTAGPVTAGRVAPAGSTMSDVKQPDTFASKSTSSFLEPEDANKAAAVQQETPSPLTFKIGNSYLTPFGYFDLTVVRRDKNIGSGVATNYGAVPFSNTVNGNLREYQLSSQNVRSGFRVNAKVKGIDVLGYLEADFQGFAPGNIAVSSHSDSMRLRLGFVNFQKNKLEILTGQAWSMLTPNRKRISPVPADEFLTQGLDSSLHVGMAWTRTPQFRLTYHASKAVTLGYSLEASEQYGGGSGGSGAVVLPSALVSTYGSQLNTGSSTLGAPNPNQDNIGKIAFDSNIGKRGFHIEVAGLFRRFAFYNPLSDKKFSTSSGGVAVNGNIELFKGFRLLGNTFYGNGGGRYIFGQGPDLIIRGDGSPRLVDAFSTMDGFEYLATPKMMIYGYYGGAYFKRATAIDPANGNQIGFGHTGSPSNHNRSLQQGTLGGHYTFWRDPNYGAMQFLTQYSYLIRHPWFVAPDQPRSAHVNMLFLSFRYILPGAPPAK